MKSQQPTTPRSRAGRGANLDPQPIPAGTAHLAPEQAAKVNRVRDALRRGEYAMDRAVAVTVDRVIADLCGE